MNYYYETNRLILKVLTEDYAPLVLQFLEDNRDIFEPYEPLKYNVYYTKEYQRHNLHAELAAFNRQQYYRFYVFLKENENEIVGTISFSNVINYPFSCANLGYKFAKKYQHQGYAMESICCALFAVFRDSNIHRINAYVMPNNFASIRLLDRIGFENEGISRQSICINGQYEDHIHYALLNQIKND